MSDWMAKFDGTRLDERLDVSAILGTVDAEGWPHAAYLSCGEILALSPDRLRLCLWPHSGTARNIAQTGRAALHVAAEGAVWEIRLHAQRQHDDGQLLMIECAIVGTVHHRAPYARVRAMIDFELLDTAETVQRWQRQIAALRLFDTRP